MDTPFRLRLITPTRVIFDEEVAWVVAEDESGSFAVGGRHERLAAALVPTILTCRLTGGGEKYVAVDRGLLRKEGRTLTIAVRRAVVGDDWRRLEELISERIVRLEDAEARARSALGRLSVSVMLRLFGYERGR